MSLKFSQCLSRSLTRSVRVHVKLCSWISCSAEFSDISRWHARLHWHISQVIVQGDVSTLHVLHHTRKKEKDRLMCKAVHLFFANVVKSWPEPLKKIYSSASKLVFPLSLSLSLFLFLYLSLFISVCVVWVDATHETCLLLPWNPSPRETVRVHFGNSSCLSLTLTTTCLCGARVLKTYQRVPWLCASQSHLSSSWVKTLQVLSNTWFFLKIFTQTQIHQHSI